MTRGIGSLWRQAGLLAGKDLKVFFLDRGALAFALLFPFVFVLIFSLIYGPSYTGEDRALTVYLATAEGPESISQDVIDALAAESRLNVRQVDPHEAGRALAAKSIRGYLFFHEGFTEAVRAGEDAFITVYVNPEAQTVRAALMSLAEAIAAEFRSYRVTLEALEDLLAAAPPGVRDAMVKALERGGGEGDGPAGAGGAATDAGPVIVFESVGDIEPVRTVDILIPAYLTMFVFFALALTAETLIAEKESHTLERLVASSATRGSIVAGKIAGAFGRGLIQVVVFWAAGLLIFKVRMGGHPGAVILVSVLMVLAASGVGVFLATVARTKKGAASLAVFISLAFAAFGGSWWPLFIMPGWLQTLAKVTPHAWANSAFNKLMLFGATPGSVLPEMAALGFFALLFLGLAAWRFRLD